MVESERCSEHRRRPYSWTGELERSASPVQTHNGSLQMSKSVHSPPRDVNDLYITPNKRGTNLLRNATPSNRRSQFNLPPSGSKFLSERLPSYLSQDDETLPKSAPLTPTHKHKIRNDIFEKKKTKSSNARRKSPPTMTMHVSEFEYFSLSEPPLGLSRPTQIFPNSDRKLKRNSKREPVEPKGEKCRDCMTRIPYATLIATILCCVGVGVFCGTMYRGTTLTLLMFDEVFRIKITWDREFRVEPVQLTFMIVGAAMGGLGLMILFLGCLSTGSTRAKVYRTWRGRVGGRVSCAIFMGITYLLSIIWLLIFTVLIIATVFYTLAWFQCQNIPENQCIDYNQFEFMFPSSTTEEDRRVCREERKTFCKDCVNNAEVMFILASVSAFLVIMSLIHYLMCLSSNYAHIKDQEKFIDLRELQYLQESEMSTLPKDRF